MIDIQTLARQAGFSESFVLPPDKFTRYERRQIDGVLHAAGRDLCADPIQTYPWANALVLLLMAYRPYPREVRTCGSYYVASNAAYHAVHALLPALAAQGVRAQRVYVPVRELALRNGIGTACRNGLTAFGAFGTRVAVQTLAAAIPDVTFATARSYQTCSDCGRCQSACPVHAITDQGFDATRCMRAYMGKETLPGWVMENMESTLGCEICQYACPLNQHIELQPEVPEAFDIARILSGESKPVRTLIGPNQLSGGRILCHAAVLAGRQNRRDLLLQLRALLDDPREQVKAAASYAIFLLQDDMVRDTMIPENSLPR